MSMLRDWDVLIGLSLVMVLAASLLRPSRNWITSCRFARSRYRRDGLAQSLRQLDREAEL